MRRIGWIILLSALFYLAVKMVVDATALSSPSKIFIEAEFDHTDTVLVAYSANAAFAEKYVSTAKPFEPGQRDERAFNLKNKPTSRLQVQIGQHPGLVRINKIVITSFFAREIVLLPQAMIEHFSFAGQSDAPRIVAGALELSSGPGARLVSKVDLPHRNSALSYGLPFLFAACLFCVLLDADLANLSAFADLHHKSPSGGVNINALDGIRGLAALMVLAEHTGLFKCGALGVQLFFALSGFLLAMPFVNDPARAVSLSYLRHYVLRRLKRIVPMYYCVITFTMLLSGKNPEVFRHYLFLQGDGHFWTIPQEIFFYLVLPVVTMGLYILTRGKAIIALPLLALLALLTNQYFTNDVISFYGLSTMIQPRTGIFLAGMLVAYVYKEMQRREFDLLVQDSRVWRIACSGAGLVLLVGLLYIGAHSSTLSPWLNVEVHYGFYGFLLSLFILVVVLTNNAMLGRLMQVLPLRAVGIVGFSFYLLHPFLVPLYKDLTRTYFHAEPHSLPSFVMVGLLTYGLAIFSYSYIERPFLSYGKPEPARRGERQAALP